MPSVLLTSQSGGFPLVSGNVWSGQGANPQGSLLLHLDRSASGSAYYGFSGAMTNASGGYFLSGGGLLDGVQLCPGQERSIPRSKFGVSGTLNLFVTCDALCSGQARLYWEAY